MSSLVQQLHESIKDKLDIEKLKLVESMSSQVARTPFTSPEEDEYGLECYNAARHILSGDTNYKVIYKDFIITGNIEDLTDANWILFTKVQDKLNKWMNAFFKDPEDTPYNIKEYLKYLRATSNNQSYVSLAEIGTKSSLRTVERTLKVFDTIGREKALEVFAEYTTNCELDTLEDILDKEGFDLVSPDCIEDLHKFLNEGYTESDLISYMNKLRDDLMCLSDYSNKDYELNKERMSCYRLVRGLVNEDEVGSDKYNVFLIEGTLESLQKALPKNPKNVLEFVCDIIKGNRKYLEDLEFETGYVFNHLSSLKNPTAHQRIRIQRARFIDLTIDILEKLNPEEYASAFQDFLELNTYEGLSSSIITNLLQMDTYCSKGRDVECITVM